MLVMPSCFWLLLYFVMKYDQTCEAFKFMIVGASVIQTHRGTALLSTDISFLFSLSLFLLSLWLQVLSLFPQICSSLLFWHSDKSGNLSYGPWIICTWYHRLLKIAWYICWMMFSTLATCLNNQCVDMKVVHWILPSHS